MIVTIEVANEAGGSSSTKRILLHSEDYPSSGELEEAAIEFIRVSSVANEKVLEDHRAATQSVW